MTLYVYDASLQRIGLVEDIDSLQWLAKYQDAGEVKLVCAATEKNLSLLVDGNRLYCTDQPESAIIRERTVNDDGKTATLTVRALFSAARWNDRVVQATENITAAAAGMLALADHNRRGLPGTSQAYPGTDIPLDTQITWGSVLEGLRTLAESSGLGFREAFEVTTGEEQLQIYAGVDRTSVEEYRGYFGTDVGNISDIELTTGTPEWKNVAIVGGEGEGSARVVVTVTLNAGSGDDRRELWVDAKDLTRTYQIAQDDGQGNITYTQATYTAEEYAAQLRGRGLEKLAEAMPTMDVSAQLGQGLMVYGKDYALGDIVPLRLSRYGVSVAARVTEVTTVYESTGKTVTATLSDYKIMEVLKQ